jgi:hypothetical protein
VFRRRRIGFDELDIKRQNNSLSRFCDSAAMARWRRIFSGFGNSAPV